MGTIKPHGPRGPLGLKPAGGRRRLAGGRRWLAGGRRAAGGRPTGGRRAGCGRPAPRPAKPYRDKKTSNLGDPNIQLSARCLGVFGVSPASRLRALWSLTAFVHKSAALAPHIVQMGIQNIAIDCTWATLLYPSAQIHCTGTAYRATGCTSACKSTAQGSHVQFKYS